MLNGLRDLARIVDFDAAKENSKPGHWRGFGQREVGDRRHRKTLPMHRVINAPPATQSTGMWGGHAPCRAFAEKLTC
jgi:hypothetical protein